MTLPRRAFLHLAAGTAALPIASSVAVVGQGTTNPTGAIRIVERTQYYAKPGLAARCTTQGFGRARLDRASSRSNIRQTSER
jgi:hypothetical protein